MKPTHFAPLLLLAALAGCGPKDARLEHLATGITKDSAIKVMGIEKPQRVEPYLVGGKYIELMFYRIPGVADSAPDRKMSPLISVDGVLIGWGWKTLDSVAAATKIPVAPK